MKYLGFVTRSLSLEGQEMNAVLTLQLSVHQGY